ncbi:hypothetical protein BHM03_00021742 [Ensete ventricosum]|nr:hypothetical protein BHM03_00021742 [Ensete ventricosum]
MISEKEGVTVTVRLLVASHLVIVGEETHEAAGGILVSLHKASQDADEAASHHGRASDVGFDPCNQINIVTSTDEEEYCYGEKAEVVEGVEVATVLVKGGFRSTTGYSGFTAAVISVFISLSPRTPLFSPRPHLHFDLIKGS